MSNCYPWSKIFCVLLFFRGNTRSDCDIVAGSPEQNLNDCLVGDITIGGSDEFIYEECDYYGEDTGFSAPPGEITNPIECEEYCLLFQVCIPK